MKLVLGANPALPAQVSLSPVALNATLNFSATFAVILRNGTLTNVFSLASIVSAGGEVACNSSVGQAAITFQLKELGLRLGLQWSRVGAIDVSSLQELVNLAVQAGLLPQINKAGASGIPIPVVDGVKFEDPSLTFGDGYVKIATDISYK